MKKIIICILVVLLLCSAGCQSVSCGNAPTQSNVHMHTDFSGVEVRVAGVYQKDGTDYLDVIWSNETACKVIYGEPYSIERLVDDQWVDCAKKGLTAFTAIGYWLESGGKTTKTYAVSYLYDISVPGTYRFKTSCSVDTGGNESSSCTLWAEFAVGERAEETAKGSAPPNPDVLLSEPPKGTLLTSGGEEPLVLGGYSWTHRMENGTAETVIADQASRPPEPQFFKPVRIGRQFAETVYAIDGVTGKCEPTDIVGYMVKLGWEAVPDRISYTCWPAEIWQNGDTAEETVFSILDNTFYAKSGEYIYEITAMWEDTGIDYYGTARYYVYIAAE